MKKKLATSMAEAWKARGERAGETIVASIKAPALFSEDYIAGVREDFNQAVSEYQRWTR